MIQRIEEITDNFEKSAQAIMYKSAPFMAALGMGSLYAYIIHKSIEGPLGWMIGIVLAAGLEFGGMHTISIASKEKTWPWIFAACIYVVTHITTLVLVEFLEIGSEIIVGSALIVAAILSYASRGHIHNLKAIADKEELNQKKVKQEEKESRLKDLQAEKDKIDMETYRAEQAENIRNIELTNRKKRSNLNKSGRTPVSPKRSEAVRNESEGSPKEVRSDSEQSEIIPLSSLSSEDQLEIVSHTYKEYCSDYESKHGKIPKSSYYDLRKQLIG